MIGLDIWVLDGTIVVKPVPETFVEQIEVVPLALASVAVKNNFWPSGDITKAKLGIFSWIW